MSETSASLRRKINSAQELQSVVRTMKALSAANISQYEQSVRALADYYRTVELGLGACLRISEPTGPVANELASSAQAGVTAVVFGSDQGLVGRFNDLVVEHALDTLATLPGNARIWAVGERARASLADAGRVVSGVFPVPNSARAIAPLVGRILLESELGDARGDGSPLHLFYNRPMAGAIYAPVSQRLLPLDTAWRRRLVQLPWPTRNLPEAMGGGNETLRALIREYLFVSLFRACAESLASENASRRAAMERADRNIGELLEHLRGNFHRLRQSGIDEELFDVIAGFEAVSKRALVAGALSRRIEMPAQMAAVIRRPR